MQDYEGERFISFTVISNYVDWTVFVAFSLLK